MCVRLLVGLRLCVLVVLAAAAVPAAAAAAAGWAPTGSMIDARVRATATPLATGRVLVAGGFDGAAYLDRAEAYDPGSRTWTPVGAMTAPRGGAIAAPLPGGRVLVGFQQLRGPPRRRGAVHSGYVRVGAGQRGLRAGGRRRGALLVA